ncbi:MAG: glycine betaine ABC transporter substrate-binding protein [Acidobacteriota bacterium]
MWLGPGPLAAAAQQGQVTVGSKKFTEGVILGEILTHLARDAGLPATHRRELGGTRVLWNALLSGEIDAYVDYTGTLTEEILAGETMRVGTNRGEAIRGEAALREALAQRDIVMSRPLGFNNTYAIGMQEAVAADLGIRQISQLRQHPDLRFGFTNEFMDRGDGWPGLRDHYRLPQSDVRGVDHDLAYRGLEAGTIQVMDLYSTDAEITVYDLRILADDLGYFPAYRPVILMRQALESDLPQVAAAWRQLAGRITEDAMVAMNARARLERVAESRVAADFLAEVFGLAVEAQVETASARFWRNTRQHLFLVGVSLGLAILLAVPLGILAARYPALGQGILALVGIFQTIPSLALLVFMIPLLGIGAPPALAALFLYSLLPIVRNTHAGLMGITAEIRESAAALGLPPGARLRLVELPLASPQILAGIKTSAVINIGTATLGALIGAGGYGQPILTGIRLDDLGLILQGAVPAAGLALLAQGFFDGLERWLVPRGLRLGRRR